MANTLQDTANYITPFARYMQPNIGTNNMPLIGIANIVRNVMLSAPFIWRFNRNNVNLTGTGNPPSGVTQGVQDYTQNFTDFGFIEKATANDGKTSWEFTDVFNTEALASSVVVGSNQGQSRPTVLSVFSDDGSGNITFRLSAVPDKSYVVNIVYQKAPVQFVATTDKWAPIPDAFSDIYNNMSLGYFLDSCQDPRGPQYIARGVAGLLARAEGLSEMDRVVFAASYMNFNSQMLLDQLKVQQAQQAKASR
jgi:hypothetical protein